MTIPYAYDWAAHHRCEPQPPTLTTAEKVARLMHAVDADRPTPTGPPLPDPSEGPMPHPTYAAWPPIQSAEPEPMPPTAAASDGPRYRLMAAGYAALGLAPALDIVRAR